jgi:hypothetical protein
VNAADHRRAAGELLDTRTRLVLPDDLRTYVEVTFGAAQQYVAAGLLERHGVHHDTHAGMPRDLRRLGYAQVAVAFDELTQLRMGRWYGRQGDGTAATECDRLLEIIRRWAESR